MAKITIFEGPDGSGKTTTALDYAKNTGALYFHFDAQPLIQNIARFYVEAMQPALLGLRDVVMDRSWLSEEPYATVYHNRAPRLDRWQCLALERLAMRCGAVVVLCDPGEDVCVRNYRDRKSIEMLDDSDQLKKIRMLYLAQYSSLPIVTWDYTISPILGSSILAQLVEQIRTPQHPVGYHSAGNWNAPVVVCCDDYKVVNKSECDGYHNWPFYTMSPDAPWKSIHESARNLLPYNDKILWLQSGDEELLEEYKLYCEDFSHFPKLIVNQGDFISGFADCIKQVSMSDFSNVSELTEIVQDYFED